MIPFPKDFQEFLKLLTKHNVRYMIVGGYALGYHGYVRATGDLDIFVEVSDENASRLVDAFKEFGFEEGLSEKIFLAKGKMVRVGRPPMRLEILTAISGVTFEESYPYCDVVEIGGISIRFIDFERLVRNKEATGRKKDQADAEVIKKRKGEAAQGDGREV